MVAFGLLELSDLSKDLGVLLLLGLKSLLLLLKLLPGIVDVFLDQHELLVFRVFRIVVEPFLQEKQLVL